MWDLISEVLEWLLDVLLWVPRKLWELLLDGLATLFEVLPVPDFMQNLASFIGELDPGIAYFGAALQLGPGITMVLGAYVIRFVIRRIPVIG